VIESDVALIMSDLKFIEREKLEKLFGMKSGYVLNFSDRTDLGHSKVTAAHLAKILRGIKAILEHSKP
jgi:hypothetical protein